VYKPTLSVAKDADTYLLRCLEGMATSISTASWSRGTIHYSHYAFCYEMLWRWLWGYSSPFVKIYPTNNQLSPSISPFYPFIQLSMTWHFQWDPATAGCGCTHWGLRCRKSCPGRNGPIMSHHVLAIRKLEEADELGIRMVRSGSTMINTEVPPFQPKTRWIGWISNKWKN